MSTALSLVDERAQGAGNPKPELVVAGRVEFGGFHYGLMALQLVF